MKKDRHGYTRIIIIPRRRPFTLALATAIVASTFIAFSLFSLNPLIQDVLAYKDNNNNETQSSNEIELIPSNSTTNSSFSTASTRPTPATQATTTTTTTTTTIPIVPSATTAGNQSQQLSPQARDKFGVEMLYPSRPGGEEWYINMANPLSDLRFNPQEPITKNKDGSWKIESDQVRMYVSTSNGYSPNQITSESGQRRVAERGFMGSPRDWRDIEITGYVKLNKFSENDNFVWYTRGGKHTDSDPCQGSSYKGNLFYHGETQFAKEQWHVSYAKSPTIPATSPLEGKWVGFKFVMYNFETSDGKSGVKLENWLDSNADGRSWEKVYEGADGGKWGRTGTDCRVKADQIISWGGPLATYRWDFAPDVDFKDLSVREINVENATVQGISYFTGTSSSSNVPSYSNYAASSATDPYGPNQNLIQSQAIRKHGGTTNSNISDPSQGSVLPGGGSGSSGVGEIVYSKQVSSGNMVYAIWVQGDEDNTDLYLKVSQDGGATFGESINLSQNPASLSYNPQIVASGQNVYIVWEDDDGNSGNSDIFFVSSSDGGKTFSRKANLSDDPSGSGSPQLSVEGNNLYVAWIGTSPDNTDVFLAQSSNNGNSFTDPVNVSNDPEISYNPILSVNGTHVLLEWTDQNEMGSTLSKHTALPNLPVQSRSIGGANEILSVETTNSSFDLGPATISGENSTSANDFENVTNKEGQIIEPIKTVNNTANASSSIDNLENIGTKYPNLSPGNSNANPNSISIDNSNNNSITTLHSPNSNVVALFDDDEKGTNTSTRIAEQDTSDKLSTHFYTAYKEPYQEATNLSAIMTAAEMEMKKTIEKSVQHSSRGTEQIQNPKAYQPHDVAVQDSQTNLPRPTQENPAALHDGDVKELKDKSSGGPHFADKSKDNLRENQEQEQQATHQRESIKGVEDQQGKQVQNKATEAINDYETESNSITESQRPLPSNDDLLRMNEQNALKLQLQKEMERQEQQQNAEIQEQIKNQLVLNKLKARNNVQVLIQKAQQALAIANELTNEAKLANQIAQKAMVEYSSQEHEYLQQQKQQEQGGPEHGVLPPEIQYLVDVARAADQRAGQAVESYNSLKNTAEISVQEFNAKYS